MKYVLPDLPFKMAELEPHISQKTLEFHYGKHLRNYIGNLNSLLPGTRFENMDLSTIVRVADGPTFYNASQMWNHIFYFEGLRPGTGRAIKGPLADIVSRSFGSFAYLKKNFSETAGSMFGVGWIWLVLNQKGLLEIIPERNAGNPLREGLVPLMTCDVWEHAYYLDYQNRWQDYLKAFWNLVNWEIIEKRYLDAVQ